MGGRNKNYDGPGFAGRYTIETAEFWMGDHRLKNLSLRDRFVLFMLGLIATVERREVLPKHVTWETLGRTWEHGGRHLGRDWERIGRRLGESGLIDETFDGRIIVCGAIKRRPNLTWKDEVDIEGIRGYKFRIASLKRAPKESKKGTRARGPLGAVSPPPKSEEPGPRKRMPSWADAAFTPEELEVLRGSTLSD